MHQLNRPRASAQLPIPLGNVREGRLEATTTISLFNDLGWPLATNVAIDTGFNGSLTLTSDTLRRLWNIPAGLRSVRLADGNTRLAQTYLVLAQWNGRTRFVIAIEGGDNLVGMEMFRGTGFAMIVGYDGQVSSAIVPLALPSLSAFNPRFDWPAPNGYLGM